MKFRMGWAALGCCAACALIVAFAPAQTARGVVFEDANGNGVRDEGERGIAGVLVSNQRDFTKTDADGHWELSVPGDCTFFVVKPSGYMTPVDGNKLPKFYYTFKPGGSPPLKFGGVKPTGALPASIDFPLTRRREGGRFQALFFGDTQSRDLKEIGYLTKTIIDKVRGSTALFGVTLGDILFDDLSIFEQHNQAIATIGIPWYNVLGNHDINYDASDNQFSDDTFERFYGPSYYSYNVSKVHFVVLNNVWWQPGSTQADGKGRYKGSIGQLQLEWLQKDLDLAPKDHLVVLMMHIPLNDTEEAKQILGLLSERPYSLSVAAHTHFQEHRFFGPESGFTGPGKHHHVVNVTCCGSWWQGSPDPYGIPHSTMRDGAPRGYSIFSFDGSNYKIEYRVAGKPAEYQMQIEGPDEVRASDLTATTIYANIFGGSEKSKVEYRFGADPAWRPMPKVLEPDPAFKQMVERDRDLKAPFRPLPDAIDSPHLWAVKLPNMNQRGTFPFHVRTTDMFGQTYVASKAIRIVD